jgi:hypothetical protein
MAANNGAIHGKTSAWFHNDEITLAELFYRDIEESIVATDGRAVWQQIKQILDCLPPATNGHAFQYFGSENKEQYDEAGDDFADGKRGYDSEDHRKFHGHAALEDVFDGLFEDRVAADEDAEPADDAEVWERLPDVEPRREYSGDYKGNPDEIPCLNVAVVSFMLLGASVGHGESATLIRGGARTRVPRTEPSLILREDERRTSARPKRRLQAREMIRDRHRVERGLRVRAPLRGRLFAL